MRRTTEQWEALLDGITPGPWVIGATLKDPLLDVSAGTCEDAKLICAAPEAVAEVVRLRREIERLRNEYLTHISDYPPHAVASMCYGTAADDLTHILEGDTDE